MVNHCKRNLILSEIVNRYLGIDQSLTSTGWVILQAGIVQNFGTIGSQKDQHVFDRAKSIALQINSICMQNKITHIAMEGLPFNAMSNVTRDLAGLMFTIGTTLIDFTPDEDMFIYPPTMIKKYATGSGKAKKEDMVAALPEGVRADFKLRYVPSRGLYDVTDAYFIARLLENNVHHGKA